MNDNLETVDIVICLFDIIVSIVVEKILLTESLYHCS